MPRVARKNIVASYIHVITQGIRKEYIFRKDTYKEKYIELVKEKFAEIEGINLLCYCIMDNHAHFLIFTEKICELSKVMAKINCSFGRYYNKEEDRVGYVFRNRYKSQVIKNQGHLNNTLVYIHRNPVKANMVADMGQYKYSSYNDMKYGKWDEKAILLLFQQKDYLDRFVNIHKNFVHKNFNEDNFLEIREDLMKI